MAPPDHPQCYALAFFGIDDRELAVQRRDTLKGLLLLGGFGFPAAVQRALAAGLTPEGSAAGMFDVPARALVAALAERIIPATDTPGAVEAGVVDFIEQIVFSWYTDAERAIFLQGLEDAGAMATTRFQQDFETLDGERQDQLLGELEQHALAAGTPLTFSLQTNLDEICRRFCQAEGTRRGGLLHLRNRRHPGTALRAHADGLSRRRAAGRDRARLGQRHEGLRAVPMNTDFDAIVVGSGISGGWAAKELSEKGLKVLVLERGAPLTHGKDYVGEHRAPWETPMRGKPLRELYKSDYAVQSTSFAFGENNRPFWNNDRENPYVMDGESPFLWMRGAVVGGKSLMWSRQVYRWSDMDFGANARDGHGIDWPLRYADIAPWYAHVERFIGVSGAAEDIPHLPDGEFLPAMDMNAGEKHLKREVEQKFADRRVIMGRAAVLTRDHNGRGACHYCGPCERGCSVGAYFSSLSSTLPAAAKTGRLTLRANSVVEGLDYDPATRKVSGVRVIDSTVVNGCASVPAWCSCVPPRLAAPRSCSIHAATAFPTGLPTAAARSVAT